MTASRRLLGLLVAALLSALVLTAPTGAAAAEPDPGARAHAPAAKVNPVRDFPRMPRKCVDPKLLIPQKPTKCNINGFKSNRPTIVIWGDSHAWQMIPALKGAANKRNVNLVAFVMGSCPVMDPALTPQQRHGSAPACLISNDRALRFVAGLKAQKKPVHVVLGTYWQRYLKAIRTGQGTDYVKEMAKYWKAGGPRLFRTLGKLRVGVDVDGQIATAPLSLGSKCFTNDYYANTCNVSRGRAIPGEKSVKSWLKKQMKRLAKPRFVNANRMCTAKTCYAKPGGVYTWWDYQHLSASMSRKLSYVFDQTVTRAGGTGRPNGGGPVLDGGEDGGGGGGGGCPLIILCR